MADFGISAILGAVGSVVSGVASLAAGAAQARMAKFNASIAEDNAVRATERSQIEAQQQDKLTLGMLGEQEAVQSASGISLGSTSSVRTRRAARELGRLDTLNVRQAGDIEAYNYKVDAANQRMQGSAAMTSGISNALGSFLGAGSSLVGGSRSSRKSFDPWTTRKGTSMRYPS
jgi:hypothetical protein